VLYQYAAELRRLAPQTELVNLAALADVLVHIANGGDASEAFEQMGSAGRQSMKLLNRTRAYAYWGARIAGKAHAEAVRAAQDHFEGFRPPDRETIARLAREYREEALTKYENGGADVSRVRHALAQRSKRGRA
jgi:hypothetical protein